MIQAPLTARDALLYLIRHWHDIHALRWLIVELADTIRQAESG